MKGAKKRDDMLSSSSVARQLQGGLDRLGAGISEKYLLGRSARRELSQFFGKLRHRSIIKIATTDVQKFTRLLFDGLDHFRMRMAGAGYGNACHEVEKN